MARITVESVVTAPIELVWDIYNNPEDIQQWNTASADWHTVNSKNDLREGGQFSNRMEAKDGSMGFDFAGALLHKDLKCKAPLIEPNLRRNLGKWST
ncbi:SRPBCC domain-containing protein [Acinetobacter guillouiae]|uniref:SRPBCC domain-containing protein n=1 Tax=Acinetobacter guillouiae TaxID=106649 RepID=UPI003AF95F88